jgi:hypothetical protein
MRGQTDLPVFRMRLRAELSAQKVPRTRPAGDRFSTGRKKRPSSCFWGLVAAVNRRHHLESVEGVRAVVRYHSDKSPALDRIISGTIDPSFCRLVSQSVLLPCQRNGVLNGSSSCSKTWAIPDCQRGACCFGCALTIFPKQCVLT